MEVAIVFITAFLVVFGIVYLYFMTRNKERMALIEKGADASIFYGQKNEGNGGGHIALRLVFLYLALIAMGVGTGIFIGGFVQSTYERHYWAMPGSIFLFAGLGLLIGVFISKKLIKPA